MWEGAGVPGENPRFQAGDRHTLSPTTTDDHRDRTRFVAMISGCIVHCATWTPQHNLIPSLFILYKYQI